MYALRIYITLLTLFAIYILGACEVHQGTQSKNANSQTSILTLAKPITADINVETSHTFHFNLTSNRFILIRAVRGSFALGEEVNLQITVRDPKGRIIETTNTADGSSLVTLFTQIPGLYSIEVHHWNGAEQGRFSLHFDVDEPAALTRVAKIDQLINHIYSKNKPGAAIAIIERGVPVFAKTFGTKDILSQQPITKDTPIELASLSKQFTAYAIAILVSEGRIALSDPISKYIEETSSFGDQITIHHLVHHLSGIKDYEDFLDESERSKENILDTIFKQDATYFLAGSEYRYSNGGYVLLSEIIERVTGETFQNFMKENIFSPLNMEATFILSSSDADMVASTKSYRKVGGGYDDLNVSLKTYQKVSTNLEAIGAAHVHASLDDMIKWANNYRSDSLGGDAVLDLIDDGIIDEDQPWDYLFGLKQFNDRGLKRRGHEGLTHGYRTLFAWYPNQDFAIIYLTNDGEWRSFYLAEKLIDIYLGEEMSPKKFSE